MGHDRHPLGERGTAGRSGGLPILQTSLLRRRRSLSAAYSSPASGAPAPGPPDKNMDGPRVAAISRATGKSLVCHFFSAHPLSSRSPLYGEGIGSYQNHQLPPAQ